MPKPGNVARATLTEAWPGSDKVLVARGEPSGPAKVVEVQFNPATLKVSLSNQAAGGTQAGGSATQFVGQGTTKLSLELWFDVTLPLRQRDGAQRQDPQGDVRNLTREIAFFMTPKTVTVEGATGLMPPGVIFQWGTFLFKGTVDSMDETLELFSEEGKPLRAGVTLTISKQSLGFEFGKARDPAAAEGGLMSKLGGALGGLGGLGAGTLPLQMARAGDTIQGAAQRAGAGDWKAVAVANGVENPRRVPPGALLNLSGAGSRAGAARLGLTGATAPVPPLPAPGRVPVKPGITVAGSGSGSSGLPASDALRLTGPGRPAR